MAAVTPEQAKALAMAAARLRLQEVDPTAGMSTMEKLSAGLSKALADLRLGGQQVIPGAPTTPAAFSTMPAGVPAGIQQGIAQANAEATARKQRDAALMATTPAKWGNFLGNMSLLGLTAPIPGANTYTGAAAIGGGLGFLQPTAAGESRALNTGVGAATSMAGQGVANLIGRALRPVQSSLSPAEQQLAEEAAKRKIPLTAGQATGSRPLQVTESVLEQLPLTSGRQLAAKQAQQEAFNRAVGSTFGSPENAITPEVAGAARERIGQAFSDLAKKNTLQADDALMSGLAQIDETARKYLTPDVGRVVLNRLDDVLARISDGKMSGTAYRNLDSELGKAARGASSGDLRNALGQLRDTLRQAMDRSISGADQAAWQAARSQYANLMTVAPLAAKDEAGNVSGRALLAAANAANRNAKFGAPSELATLGRIGRAFVAEQIPNSGTAQRQFIQNLLTSGGGAGLGAIGAAATGNDPLKGAAIGASAMLAPRAAQMVLNSSPIQAYLTRGLLAMTPQELAAMGALSRGSALGLLGVSNASQ